VLGALPKALLDLALLALLRHGQSVPDCATPNTAEFPRELLEKLVEKQDAQEVLLAVAMNPQTPREILEKLVWSKYAQVVEAARLHVNWAGEMTLSWNDQVSFLLLHPKIGFVLHFQPSTFNLQPLCHSS
jgi:hypothetical protein